MSSFWGPRVIVRNGQQVFDVHGGIDFAGPPNEGDPVFSLEAGTIRQIVASISPPRIVIVRITGEVFPDFPEGRNFRYLHLFPDSGISNLTRTPTPSTMDVDVPVMFSGQTHVVRLTRRVYRIDGDAIRQDSRLAIVRFAPGSTMLAEAILHPEQSAPIFVKLPSGQVVCEVANPSATLFATNQVSNREVIGPVGTSGGFDAHLHIDMRDPARAETMAVGGGLHPFVHMKHIDGITGQEVP